MGVAALVVNFLTEQGLGISKSRASEMFSLCQATFTIGRYALCSYLSRRSVDFGIDSSAWWCSNGWIQRCFSLSTLLCVLSPAWVSHWHTGGVVLRACIFYSFSNQSVIP